MKPMGETMLGTVLQQAAVFIVYLFKDTCRGIQMVLMALLSELDTELKSSLRQTYFKRKLFINLNSILVTPTILFYSQHLNDADG